MGGNLKKNRNFEKEQFLYKYGGSIFNVI